MRARLIPRTSAALAALALGAATIAIACVPPVEIHVVSFGMRDFASYRTFSFAPTEGTANGYQSSARSAEVRRRARLLVASFLEHHGYLQKSDGQGDFVVQIAAGRREREELRTLVFPHPVPTRPAWFEEHEEEDFVEGILVIDLLDGKTSQPLWHGAASVEINPDKIDDQLLRRATSKVLDAFPWPTIHRPT